ncbi:MAG TPA: hypothetical protein VFK14_09850 [Solirubrobacterales bacterium]|nr:hypothetical protein [Solirubrobacterales bacterium]
MRRAGTPTRIRRFPTAGILCALLVLCMAGSAQAASAGWQLIGATGPTNLPPVNSEIQKVSVDATAGQFTLTFAGQTTSPLAFNARPGEVEAALDALSTVGGASGSVEVSGGPGSAGAGDPYFVRFGGGTLAGKDVAEMTGAGSGGAAVVVGTRTQGGTLGEGTIVAWATNVGGASSSGIVTMRFRNLPPGIVTAGAGPGEIGQGPAASGWSCPGTPGDPEVICTLDSALHPVASGNDAPPVLVPVKIEASAPDSGSVEMEVSDQAGNSATYELAFQVTSRQAPPGIQSAWAGSFDADGDPATGAGEHPGSAAVGFRVNTYLAPTGRVLPSGDLRDVRVGLPPGFAGNPTATSRCPQNVPTRGGTSCTSASVVGTEGVIVDESGKDLGSETSRSFIYNDDPPTGWPAQFGFTASQGTVRVLATVRSEEDFGLTATAPTITQFFNAYGSYNVLEGVPAASGGKAFLTNPSDCAEQARLAPVVTIAADSWQMPGVFDTVVLPQPVVTGCDKLHFEPEFSFQPNAGGNAQTTSGATAHLHIDQAGLIEPDELAPPQLKRSVVTLPQGLTLNPASADGLQACTTQQMGLLTTEGAMPNPIRFDEAPVTCPDASKIGTAEIETPLLEETLQGTVYLAAQDENPFHSLLALYLVVDDAKTGIVVKLPGKIEADPNTGQLTATFDDNPQVPFEDLTLNFRGGPGQPRSTLATPDTCGKYTTDGEWTPWSAPESGPPARTENSFDVSKGVGGSAACPTTKAARPFDLGLSAGTTNADAGAHSPFTLRLTRPDGNQEIDKVSVVAPPGLVASFRGLSTCSPEAIASAGAPGRSGKEELANPSCPASSQIGTTTVAVGVGSNPLEVKTGKAYLTGPYKGAPLSFTFIVPAVAGPFDLGVQVVRTAVYINPKTAQVTAVSDAIPQILRGIPLLVREVRVDLDRPGFTLNPTNCEPMNVLAQVSGASGAVANLSNRFQAANCGALAFHPGLKLQLHGGTKRGKYQRLEATVTYPEGPGYANISRAAVTLPHSEFLAQEHIRTVCTRVQFAAHECPRGSIYGHAEAITPLLDQPLTGPVYLRSSDNPLPDLVAALRGPDSRPIEIELSGRTDSKHGGIRNTFDLVPDAPVTKFTLKLFGGKKSLIVNSRNLCKGKKQRATVRMNAQNGMRRRFRPVVKNDCGKRVKKAHRGHRRT